MSDFAILRTKKIKSSTDVRNAQQHNLRQRYANNVDKEKSKDNSVLVDTFGISKGGDLANALTSYYEDLGIKQKINSVQMMEFVLTASPEFFEGKAEAEIQKWEQSQLDFMRQKFGDSVKLVVVHRDETSPHLQVLISTEQKTVKKYKNQHGLCEKESYSLNVKRFNRTFLRELQTEYANHNKEFGLQRGLMYSQATHRELKDFYRDIKRASTVDYTKKVTSIMGKVEANFFGYVKKTEVEAALKPVLVMLATENKKYKTFIQNYKHNVGIINQLREDLEKQKEQLEVERKKAEEEKEKLAEQANKNHKNSIAMLTEKDVALRDANIKLSQAMDRNANYLGEIKMLKTQVSDLSLEIKDLKKSDEINFYQKQYPDNTRNELIKKLEEVKQAEEINQRKTQSRGLRM